MIIHFRNVAMNASQVQEIKYKAIRPNSFDKDLDGSKQETKMNAIDNHHKPDQLLDSLESPMLDLSYLGINQTDNRPPRWGRSISLPIGVKSQVMSQQNSPILRNEVIMKKNTSQEIAEKVRTPTPICFAELKRHYVPKRSIVLVYLMKYLMTPQLKLLHLPLEQQ